MDCPYKRVKIDLNFDNDLKNILNKNFIPKRLNAVWLTDITYQTNYLQLGFLGLQRRIDFLLIISVLFPNRGPFFNYYLYFQNKLKRNRLFEDKYTIKKDTHFNTSKFNFTSISFMHYFTGT